MTPTPRWLKQEIAIYAAIAIILVVWSMAYLSH